MNNPSIFTTGDVSQRFNVPIWQIRRLYDRGILPPAQRVGSFRVILEGDLPAIESALRTAGYLPVRPQLSEGSGNVGR